MKVNYKYMDYVRYWPGDSRVHVIIDAPHCSGEPNESDERTMELSHDLAEATGAGVIQALMPRTIADLNRDIDFSNVASVQAHAQQRKALYHILKHKNVLNTEGLADNCFLYVSLHGMKNGFSTDLKSIDIEIGTRWGALCEDSFADYLNLLLSDSGSNNVLLNNKFIGSKCLYWHINGDPRVPAYKGYGRNFKIVQIELSRALRFKYYDNIFRVLADCIGTIHQDIIENNKSKIYSQIH
ncbi:MAG: hypothetical protein ACP59X_04900 [Solidesulfovibrio sp. DCME]|uniref:hypothetical protein n=1 Tax=Solidesulfovibrio sp. DCME TaxID=3447380 RepID=UPI003D0DB457